MLELHVVRAKSEKYDLECLDPDSLVAASYLQLLRPSEWTIVASDPSLSPNGALPYLKDGLDRYSASSILPHLLRTSPSTLSPKTEAEARAFHAFLDTNLLPLTLHTFFSLPQNWTFVRPLIAESLPFPSKFYQPEQLRQSAKFVVDANHPGWWGMGGETEKDEEDERKRRKAMLDTGIEGFKERKEGERKEGKEKMKKAFGESKISVAARNILLSLESTLAASSTPFFHSSSVPTPLDAHLSSLLSLVLFLPLPTPILSDLINSSFPRLWSHTNLLRRTLWSERPRPPLPDGTTRSPSVSWSQTIADFTPSFSLFDYLSSENGTRRASLKKKDKPKSKQEKDFERKRWMFAGVVVVGVLGWALGTGAVTLPGRKGIWDEDDDEEEEGEWEEVLEGDDDEEDDGAED
ncbi:hypothetical protein T439DRAFT_324425 [Meredithblackwellia eburnea MCA 4105]